MAIDIVPKEEVLASDYGRTPSILYVDGNRAGETYTQDGSQFRPFRTITAAVAASGAGDTIVVAPQTAGPYTEAAIVLPASVSLEGIAGNYTYINGDVTAGAGPCSIKYIAFTGAANVLTIKGGTTMRDVYNYGRMSLPDAVSKAQMWNCHITSTAQVAVTLANADAEFYSVMGKLSTTADNYVIDSIGKVILDVVEVTSPAGASKAAIRSITSGYLRLFNSSVVNVGAAPAINAANGAGAGAPNVLNGVIVSSGGANALDVGAAVTLYNNVSSASGTITGAGIVKGAATDGAVMEVDYTAQTVLAAVTSGSPSPITLNASTVLARLAAGDVKAASVAEMQTLLNVEAGADATDATNVEAAGAAMRTGMITVGDLMTAASIGPVVQGRIQAGAVGTVLVGNGAGVVPTFQAIAGVALDVVDVVLTIPDSGSGVDTIVATGQVNDLSGAPIAHQVDFVLYASTTQYCGHLVPNANVTFSLPTVGALLANTAGWGVIQTSAAGAFSLTLTNAAHEHVWFSASSVPGGNPALAEGAIVRGCIPVAVEWKV